MLRRFLLITGLLLLPGCGESPKPSFHPDAQTIEQAVQHAQAQADGPGGEGRP